jgi:hypothetical protein
MVHMVIVWDLNFIQRLQPDTMVLQKKSHGRLIHVSDFINEEDGRLVVCNGQGKVVRDARKIIYPGASGDTWWDTKQLLTQVTEAIDIFNAAHPDCEALFIFDQSSAYASLGVDALRAFDMNKGNGGKQQKQKDMIIPNDVPDIEARGKVQKMTMKNGDAKGLHQVLEERGIDTQGLRAKCAPVCPFENERCCMAHILSKHADFANQISLLEELIMKAGHHCIFLPKFHCELNPIEMVCTFPIHLLFLIHPRPFYLVLGIRKVSLLRNLQAHICASQGGGTDVSQCMPSRNYMPFY